MPAPETTPVIIAIGEYVDRPEDPRAALEPVALMARALQAADADGGGGLAGRIEALDLVGLISWRYEDPAAQLCCTLGIAPRRMTNASMGGETPVRLIHEAAIAVAKGELRCAAIVGGEASHARNRARKDKIALPWTPMASRERAVRFPSSAFALSPVARRLGVRDPVQIYPFYEMATQHAWGQSPAAGQECSARLWAQYAATAAGNPSAWTRSAPDSAAIAAAGPDNRLISWPYLKSMVANPAVNQAAAVIVGSLALVRELGIAEDRLVHIWGGAGAEEPEDYLHRDRYDHSSAQKVVLEAAVDLAGGAPERFGFMELYSCFPVVPKMALRVLGLDPQAHPPTVTGGLSFFGGPLNTYMTHAACAMVRALRAAPGEIGLLYGQGGYVNKHQSLVVSTRPAPRPIAHHFSVQTLADAGRDAVPPLADAYTGPATIETYTITYDRHGDAIEGVVILRTPDGRRTMARVPVEDGESLDLLRSSERSAIGTAGCVRRDVFGKPVWEARPAPAARPRRFIRVEQDGPVTLITIARPDALNALHPAANAELAEAFDAFEADPGQWVAILTGAGERAFCVGNDLKFHAAAMARGVPLEIPETGFAGLTARFDLTKPVIAAVNGAALGGGFEIALACDLIIASTAASFALPEPKVGLAALAGGLLRLPRQIGLKAAMGLILTGRTVDAEEGQRLGAVNAVTTPEALLDEARRWAAEICALSPMSIRASKEVVHRGLDDPSLASAYAAQTGFPAVQAMFRSADMIEGPLAFAQKRPPRWTGS